MESSLYGLTAIDFRSLVYRLEIGNNKLHPLNNVKKEAVKGWVQSFFKEAPKIV